MRVGRESCDVWWQSDAPDDRRASSQCCSPGGQNVSLALPCQMTIAPEEVEVAVAPMIDVVPLRTLQAHSTGSVRGS